jgi:predicted TIM-barrel fold metal-dependent hydrolase
MRVDAFTHFIPKPFADRMAKIAGNFADIGKRMREIPCVADLDERRRVVDQFKDYCQILSYPMPPIENIVEAGQTEELCRIINDGFVDICAKHRDHFPGWVAQVSLASPEGAVREAERAVKLGALGVQVFTNIKGKPLDRPEFAPFFEKMNALGKPIWLHPYRGANHPDYLDEKKSLYEIWWTFGWSYETAAAMARLVFSKTLDNNPDLKVIVHHFGGIVPILEGRIGPGWDQIGARTSDEDYQKLKKSLKKRPLNYFKENFYTDTAVFGGKPATECGLAFYPNEKIVFASDCPFDPEKGTYYIRETLNILDNLDMSKKKRKAIMYGNLEKITGRTLVK